MQNQQKASSFKLKSKYAENLCSAWVLILISKSRRSTTSKTEEKCEANFSPDTSNNCISIVPSKFWLAWAKNLQNNLQRNCFFWSAPLVSPTVTHCWLWKPEKMQRYIQRTWSWSFPCSLCFRTVRHCWIWKPKTCKNTSNANEAEVSPALCAHMPTNNPLH